MWLSDLEKIDTMEQTHGQTDGDGCITFCYPL